SSTSLIKQSGGPLLRAHLSQTQSSLFYFSPARYPFTRLILRYSLVPTATEGNEQLRTALGQVWGTAQHYPFGSPVQWRPRNNKKKDNKAAGSMKGKPECRL